MRDKFTYGANNIMRYYFENIINKCAMWGDRKYYSYKNTSQVLVRFI